jgi:hypothetical protein
MTHPPSRRRRRWRRTEYDGGDIRIRYLTRRHQREYEHGLFLFLLAIVSIFPRFLFSSTTFTIPIAVTIAVTTTATTITTTAVPKSTGGTTTRIILCSNTFTPLCPIRIHNPIPILLSQSLCLCHTFHGHLLLFHVGIYRLFLPDIFTRGCTRWDIISSLTAFSSDLFNNYITS